VLKGFPEETDGLGEGGGWIGDNGDAVGGVVDLSSECCVDLWGMLDEVGGLGGLFGGVGRLLDGMGGLPGGVGALGGLGALPGRVTDLNVLGVLPGGVGVLGGLP